MYERRHGLAATAVVAAIGWMLLGCGDERGERRDVSARNAEAFDLARNDAASEQRALEQTAQRVLEASEEDLIDARYALDRLAVAARASLEAAVERTEHASDALRAELERLRGGGAGAWEETERRLSAALEELNIARRELDRALRTEANATQVTG